MKAAFSWYSRGASPRAAGANAASKAIRMKMNRSRLIARQRPLIAPGQLTVKRTRHFRRYVQDACRAELRVLIIKEVLHARAEFQSLHGPPGDAHVQPH